MFYWILLVKNEKLPWLLFNKKAHISNLVWQPLPDQNQVPNLVAIPSASMCVPIDSRSMVSFEKWTKSQSRNWALYATHRTVTAPNWKEKTIFTKFSNRPRRRRKIFKTIIPVIQKHIPQKNINCLHSHNGNPILYSYDIDLEKCFIILNRLVFELESTKAFSLVILTYHKWWKNLQ